MIPKPEDVAIPDDKVWEEMSPELRYYYRNKSDWIEGVGERKNEIKNWVRSVKSGKGCSECGETHPACLDFHHIEGEKETTISQMAHQGRSRDDIQDEIKKCVVLCANCHRKEHWDDNYEYARD